MFTNQSLLRIKNEHEFTLELCKLPVSFGSQVCVVCVCVCVFNMQFGIGILGRVLFADQQTHCNLKLIFSGEQCLPALDGI